MSQCTRITPGLKAAPGRGSAARIARLCAGDAGAPCFARGRSHIPAFHGRPGCQGPRRPSTPSGRQPHLAPHPGGRSVHTRGVALQDPGRGWRGRRGEAGAPESVRAPRGRCKSRGARSPAPCPAEFGLSPVPRAGADARSSGGRRAEGRGCRGAAAALEARDPGVRDPPPGARPARCPFNRPAAPPPRAPPRGAAGAGRGRRKSM